MSKLRIAVTAQVSVEIEVFKPVSLVIRISTSLSDLLQNSRHSTNEKCKAKANHHLYARVFRAWRRLPIA